MQFTKPTYKVDLADNSPYSKLYRDGLEKNREISFLKSQLINLGKKLNDRENEISQSAVIVENSKLRDKVKMLETELENITPNQVDISWKQKQSVQELNKSALNLEKILNELEDRSIFAELSVEIAGLIETGDKDGLKKLAKGETISKFNSSLQKLYHEIVSLVNSVTSLTGAIQK